MSNDLRHIAITSSSGLSFATFSFFSCSYKTYIGVLATASIVRKILCKSGKNVYQDISVMVYKSELFSLVRERGQFCLSS